MTNIIDRVTQATRPVQYPTPEDLAMFREYMANGLSPNGNRYGGYDDITIPAIGRLENYVKWRYRLSQAEYDRLARLALIEAVAPTLFDELTGQLMDGQ